MAALSPGNESSNLLCLEDVTMAVAGALKDIMDSTAYITIKEYNSELDIEKLRYTSKWIRARFRGTLVEQIPSISESAFEYRRLLCELHNAIPLTSDLARHFNDEIEAFTSSFVSRPEAIQLGQQHPPSPSNYIISFEHLSFFSCANKTAQAFFKGLRTSLYLVGLSMPRYHQSIHIW
ncbi:hypothetical protein CPB84DRAFT_185868 [Gymnopilus junonius]|uniref:Uncharacterized protein n=1 Tax=Gymnopilus junonius TaxID=109634 RepID=A0A9P5NGJ1_GYMJU|nr:hypothetical protein CPB84DRAFT_185868 [Gymnopilus junonius]